MTLNAIFSIASSSMAAETERLKSSATNMSNANIESGSPDEVYKAHYPIYKSIQYKANEAQGNNPGGGVVVVGTYESQAEPIKHYEPDNPMADQSGFVYTPNINYVEEMANVISASRSYEMSVELMGTTKQLMQRTLQLGQ